MKNLTLTVDETVLQKARKIAADRGTSVNALVRQYLADLGAEHKDASDRLARMRAISEKEGFEIGPITWTRDDLYER